LQQSFQFGTVHFDQHLSSYQMFGTNIYAEQSVLWHKACQMVCRDMASGSDSWAVKQGWVSITPLGLRSDIIFSQVSHIEKSSNKSAPKEFTFMTVYHVVPMVGPRLKAL